MDIQKNQIYCMDCMELFPQIPDESVSMILTDPPYGIGYRNHFAGTPHPPIIGDEGIDYENFARESCRILKNNSHAYFLHGLTVIPIISAAWRMPDSP